MARQLTDRNWPELARQANWSATNLAKLCGRSLRTLERHFTKTFGCGPHEWLANERLKWAQALLADGATVKEAAFNSGYAYAQHFSRDFKKKFGYGPAQANAKQQPVNI
jgi:transcriptional regulator GlxA family with amidase domain